MNSKNVEKGGRGVYSFKCFNTALMRKAIQRRRRGGLISFDGMNFFRTDANIERINSN